MVTLTFPKLNKALKKNTKDDAIDSPYRGIIVIDNSAIVYRENFCIVVNLYDHFTISCGVNSDDELKAMEGILMYMNGKIFSNEFWEELTKGANMKMSNGNLHVSNPKYSKDLHYSQEVEPNILSVLKELEIARYREEKMVNCISVPFNVLKSIYDTCPELKQDHMILQFDRQDAPVKFTFKNYKHFYGYIYPDYNSTQEQFKFANLEAFVDEQEEYIKELEENSRPAPPPPSNEEEE